MRCTHGDYAKQKCKPYARLNEAVIQPRVADGDIKYCRLTLASDAEAPGRTLAQRNQARVKRCAVRHATCRPRDVEDVHLVATRTRPSYAIADDRGATGRARADGDRKRPGHGSDVLTKRALGILVVPTAKSSVLGSRTTRLRSTGEQLVPVTR